MKTNKHISILLLSLFFIFSCQKSNEKETLIEEISTTINYDGENFAAPRFPRGTYEAAAKYTSQMTKNYIGYFIEEIDFFLAGTPSNCTVKIYTTGEKDSPSELLYAEKLTDFMSVNQWNKHTLVNPIEITGEEIWVSLEFTVNGAQLAIGCDPGPRNINGDWVYQKESNEWNTFHELTGGESVNWNIRAIVSSN